MCKKSMITAALILFLTFSGLTYAASDDFSGYAPGSSIADQGSWILDGGTAVVTTAAASGDYSTNGLSVDGSETMGDENTSLLKIHMKINDFNSPVGVILNDWSDGWGDYYAYIIFYDGLIGPVTTI